MASETKPTEFAAATAVVVRDGTNGLEVLMLQRSDHGQFANMWVFPGGRVDASDAGDDEIQRARSAAVRETQEEVQLRIDAESLVPWSHWSPPAAVPKRFLTWFFVAPWQSGEPVVDGHEIVDYRWVPTAVAHSQVTPVAPPTFVTLNQLSAYESFAALRDDPDHTVERFVTRFSNNGPRLLLWHGDVDYDTGNDTSNDTSNGNGADPDDRTPLHRLIIPTDGPMRYVRTR